MHRHRTAAATAALLALLTTAPLSAMADEVRIYDPAYRDYHQWNSDEDVIYHGWWIERREPYREFRSLDPEQQEAYWKWRHKRHEHEEHHDRD